MIIDAGCNMLVALNTLAFKGIVCMVHKLNIVHRAIGLGSALKPDWDAGTQETWALLEQCHQLVGHFLHCLKSAC